MATAWAVTPSAWSCLVLAWGWHKCLSMFLGSFLSCFWMLKSVCVLHLFFYNPGSTTVNPLAIAYVNPLAGYFFSSAQHQSLQASHLALQLNPESAGLFTCIPNQHKTFPVFLGQVHQASKGIKWCHHVLTVLFWFWFTTESKSAGVSCKGADSGMYIWTTGAPKPCFPKQWVWF